MTDTISYQEQEVVARIARDDQQAFTELFNHYEPVIYTYVRRLTRSETLAEEIVQDTFLKAWLKRETLPGIQNLVGWLYTIAGNLTFSALRKADSQSQQVKQFQKQQTSSETEDTFTTTESFLLKEQYDRLLKEAMQTLPQRQQEALRLTKIEGMSQKEAADRMGISAESVKTHLSVAMQKVRAYCVANKGMLGLLLFFWATR